MLGLPLVLPLGLGLLWAGLAYSGTAPPYLLPPPHEVGRCLWSYIAGVPGAGPFAGRFASDLAASMSRVGAGFALATLVGLPLGLLSGRSRNVRLMFSGLVNGVRSVPGISWLPLALVWFGIGFKTTVFLVSLAAFFPIYLNTLSGVASVPSILLQAGTMFGLGRLGLVFRVLIPAGMGQILTGLRLGLGLAFAYLVLGELTGVPDGLGAVIMDARMVGRVDVIMSGILVIAMVGWLSDLLLTWSMQLAFRSARRLP